MYTTKKISYFFFNPTLEYYPHVRIYNVHRYACIHTYIHTYIYIYIYIYIHLCRYAYTSAMAGPADEV